MAEQLLPIYRHVLETGEPVTERELSAETPGTGKARHVLASWFPVRVGDEVAGVGVVVVDITERKAAEMRLGAVLTQLPLGVIIADAEGRMLLSNERLREMRMPSIRSRGEAIAEAEFTAWHADGRPYRVHEWPLMRSL